MHAAVRYRIGLPPTVIVPASQRNKLYVTTVANGFPNISGSLVDSRSGVELRVYASGSVDSSYESIINAGALVEVRLSNSYTGEWELVGSSGLNLIQVVSGDVTIATLESAITGSFPADTLLLLGYPSLVSVSPNLVAGPYPGGTVTGGSGPGIYRFDGTDLTFESTPELGTFYIPGPTVFDESGTPVGSMGNLGAVLSIDFDGPGGLEPIETFGSVGVASAAVLYDNTTSGLTAATVQAALDELAASGDARGQDSAATGLYAFSDFARMAPGTVHGQASTGTAIGDPITWIDGRTAAGGAADAFLETAEVVDGVLRHRGTLQSLAAAYALPTATARTVTAGVVVDTTDGPGDDGASFVRLGFIEGAASNGYLGYLIAPTSTANHQVRIIRDDSGVPSAQSDLVDLGRRLGPGDRWSFTHDGNTFAVFVNNSEVLRWVDSTHLAASLDATMIVLSSENVDESPVGANLPGIAWHALSTGSPIAPMPTAVDVGAMSSFTVSFVVEGDVTVSTLETEFAGGGLPAGSMLALGVASLMSNGYSVAGFYPGGAVTGGSGPGLYEWDGVDTLTFVRAFVPGEAFTIGSAVIDGSGATTGVLAPPLAQVVEVDLGDGLEPVIGTTMDPASTTSYDNTTSGLTAADVQAALDELAASAGVVLSDADPDGLGTAAPGVSDEASRSDHVHPMPSYTDVGADAAGAAQAVADSLGTAALADTGDFATAAQGTDARTPTAHAASHQDGGADELALDGSQITAGTVATARLGSGTPDAFTFLDGTGAWVADVPVFVAIKNTTASTITKGAALVATGSVGASGAVEVGLADADDPTKMPAIGLAATDIVAGASGHAVVTGMLRGISTTGYSINAPAYVSTTAGQLTPTRPTGTSELVQNIGRVVRVHGSTGEILVLGPGRSNDIPNSIDGAAIGSGIVAVARLGTGTPSSGNFLRGDGSWQAAGGGTVDVVSNVAADRILGRTTAGSGDSEELTAAQARTLLGVESVSAFYGLGIDGDVTIAAGTTTLTNDMYYNNLTVTGTLVTNGYRVFVAGTLSGAGTIHCNGAAATSQSGGTAGGLSTTAPFIKGVDGGSGNVGAGSQCAAGTVSQLGTTGGAGGLGSNAASVAARAVSPPGQSAGGTNAYQDVIQVREARPVGPSPTRFAGGNGGTGGSGDGTNAGGGGGGAGGCCVVFARYCTFTGTISANGGSGATRSSGNVGGGGGGGGGFAMLCTSSPTATCTVQATGGAAGNGVGTGTAGVAGTTGNTAIFLGVR
jgi:hypothetical protein